MALPSLAILDVGHGNSAILYQNGRAIVFDAPATPTLFDALDFLGISEIDALLISHADADHISGATALLADSARRPVHSVHLNADQPRRTATYNNFRSAVRAASARGTRVSAALTSHCPEIDWNGVTVSVLHPSPDLQLGGPKSKDSLGKTQTPNSLSAVLLISTQESRLCLLTGDLDRVGLDELLARDVDLTARVLVFPHHGGAPSGADPAEFSKELVSRVEPGLVVISLGRKRYANPVPEIISGILDSPISPPHLACTQLSSRCAASLSDEPNAYLWEAPASGKDYNECCAGSLDLPLDQVKKNVEKLIVGHLSFVREKVAGAICARAQS